MIELKRKVKKEVDETYTAELKEEWCVRILKPNGNRTYYCSYEEIFAYEPNEQEIASILVDHHRNNDEFASVVKNYRLVEVKGVCKNIEHDGCINCLFADRLVNEVPCVNCKQSYSDKYIHKNKTTD